MTGKQVKELRTRKALTQNDMAYLLNVTPKSIKNWEKAEEKQVKPLYTLLLESLDKECPDASEQIKERLNAL